MPYDLQFPNNSCENKPHKLAQMEDHAKILPHEWFYIFSHYKAFMRINKDTQSEKVLHLLSILLYVVLCVCSSAGGVWKTTLLL